MKDDEKKPGIAAGPSALGPHPLHQPPTPFITFSIPARAQPSSAPPPPLSPGVPEIPIAPTTVLPALIGTPPAAVVMLARCSGPALPGLAAARLPYSPEGMA